MNISGGGSSPTNSHFQILVTYLLLKSSFTTQPFTWREFLEARNSGCLSAGFTLLASTVATYFNVTTAFSGPVSVMFCILYSYSRVIPSAYRYRVFGLSFTDKSPVYGVALLVTIIGILSGAACRSDLFPFKAYRLPNWIIKIASAFRPLIGATEPGFRSISALPERGVNSTDLQGSTDEPLTTNVRMEDTGGVNTENNAAPNRSPTQEEISQLTAMFPNATRVQILNALTSTYVYRLPDLDPLRPLTWVI
ncbi:5567_t:CDS:2 [Acaulospora colombiana]|uniref:5567_t:CDS:1 n=1 Tax=Acaulospora colombiana TaxID=27376 RepID=A0ACA9MCV0_9GLOM|nr:5567_t:CDS:2 [Acaulospora colombiana]